MIEGLKVTVSSEELKEICETRAGFHKEKSLAYQKQVVNLKKLDLSDDNNAFIGKLSSGDPKDGLMEKANDHTASHDEMKFISKHLKSGENYLLDNRDLQKLGIIKSNRMW